MSVLSKTRFRVLKRLRKHRIINDAGCWEWMARTNAKGYGEMYYSKRTRLVHRVSLTIFKGFDITSDTLVLHRCDNPRCFRPSHLFTGDHKANVRDCIDKGRFKGFSNLEFGRDKEYTINHFTHCKRGHSLTNSYFISNRRVCKICSSMRSKKYYAARKQK